MIASWSISNLSSTSTTPWFVIERRRVARHEVVVDDVQIVAHLDRVELGRRVAELRVPVRDPQKAAETGQQDEATEGTVHGSAVYRKQDRQPAAPAPARTAASTSSSDGKPKAVFCATRDLPHPGGELAARAFDELRLDARRPVESAPPHGRRADDSFRPCSSESGCGVTASSPRLARRSGWPGGRSCLRGTRTRTPAACRLSSGSSRTSTAASTYAHRRAWRTSRPSSARST